MANRSLAEKHAATGRDQDGVPSVRSYRTAADAELRAYGRSVSAYERDVEQLTRRAARPVRHADERAGASRSSDTHTINRLLLEWEDDRTMAAVVGNGERPADRRRDLYRTGAPVRSSARPALEDREGVVALSAAFLTAPRQAPAILAALALAVAMMSVWFVPATPVTGLLAAPTLTLPRTGDAELALAEFSTPMSEDMLSVDTSQIDPHKFDMLTLRDYVVQPGETLSQIAARFNLRVDTIISVNDI